jgi:hypothetical protein
MFDLYAALGDGGIYKIKRPKLGGLPGFHFGLALPDNSVIDFGYDTHIRHTDPYTFSAGLDIITVSPVPEIEHVNVYHRLQLAVANPAAYDFWQWNCENFVNFLIGEEPRSDQIRWLGLAAAVTTIAAIASRAK